MPLVTCTALAMALANPATSGDFTLTEDCAAARSPDGRWQPALLVPVRFAAPVVVKADGRRIEGLAVVNGGNISWVGGAIVAPGGVPDRAGAGQQYYGVLVDGSAGVTLDGVHLTAARKAVTVRRSSEVTLRNSRCDGEVEDCMIVADSRTIRFANNVVGPITVKPSQCWRGNVVTERVPRQRCEADGGRWIDGWHSDVLQLRNGVTDVLASGNRINTQGQGLTQMDTVGDRPLANVRFENNVIASGRNGLTLTNCSDCRITGNTLRSAVPGWRSVIRPGQALACGNIVPDGGAGRENCPG